MKSIELDFAQKTFLHRRKIFTDDTILDRIRIFETEKLTGIDGIALGHTILIRKKRYIRLQFLSLIAHEIKHVEKNERHFFGPFFYVLYIIEHLLYGHKSSRFEKEAREAGRKVREWEN